jgi:hypothetical protein
VTVSLVLPPDREQLRNAGFLRAYVLGPDGRIIQSYEFVRPGDEAAKVRVKQDVDGHDIELWQGRRVAKFPHKE